MPNPRRKNNQRRKRKSRHPPKRNDEDQLSQISKETEKETYNPNADGGYSVIGSTNKTNGSKTDEVEQENVDYLMLIAKIVNELQIENNEFPNVIKKILDVNDTTDTTTKTMKYGLMNTMLVILSESNLQELSYIKKKVEDIMEFKHMCHLYVDNRSIACKEILSEGAFGSVFQGNLRRDDVIQSVAVKINKDRKYDKLFHREAWAMSQFEHENIVKILAISEDNTEIVIELMTLGSINDALSMEDFTVRDILQILSDVASGMEYLHGKGFLHRDLACSNILIDDRKRCKIGDFGFCVYVGNSDGVFEEKVFNLTGFNISPESYETQLFTVKSDVWAMGILIWHVFYMLTALTTTTCIIPPMFVSMYLTLYRSRLSREEAVLEKPHLCPPILFSYCRNHLLNRKAVDRPNFTDIKRKMLELLKYS